MGNDNKQLTPQEEFWRGEFGDKYIERNKGARLLASNVAFFSRVLTRCGRLDSVIEFGANIGMNLSALKILYPELKVSAVEINQNAAKQLRASFPDANLYVQSILDFDPSSLTDRADMALIKTVLIHINPTYLASVYERLCAATKRYILLCEYYNPTPVNVSYRGHEDRLFKRDFSGELMDAHPEFKLIDYGFAYHRDPAFPLDDISWFLMERW